MNFKSLVSALKKEKKDEFREGYTPKPPGAVKPPPPPAPPPKRYSWPRDD